MKTITELQERWWYRAIKMFYLIGVACNFIFTTVVLLTTVPFDISVWLIVAAAILNFIVYGWFFPGVFFYITLGKFNPPVN